MGLDSTRGLAVRLILPNDTQCATTRLPAEMDMEPEVVVWQGRVFLRFYSRDIEHHDGRVIAYRETFGLFL